MGMVDVYLPLIYSEGEKEALQRLHNEIKRQGELLLYNKNKHV
jgi:hypothetical protein